MRSPFSPARKPAPRIKPRKRGKPKPEWVKIQDVLKAKKIPGRVPVPGVAWVDKRTLLALGKKQKHRKPTAVPKKNVTHATVYVVWTPKKRYAAYLGTGARPQQLKGIKRGEVPDRILQQRHIVIDKKGGIAPDKLAEYIHTNRAVLIPESGTSEKVQYLGLVAVLPRSGTTGSRLHKFLGEQAKKAWATRRARGKTRTGRDWLTDLSRD